MKARDHFYKTFGHDIDGVVFIKQDNSRLFGSVMELFEWAEEYAKDHTNSLLPSDHEGK